jgi:rRNA-processing protein FCF1
MQRVLIDACGWVACVDAKLNVERELETLLGPCEWMLLPSVHRELQRLQGQRPRSKSLLLALLEAKSTPHVPDATGGEEAASHTDDEIFACAQAHGWVTLTVDSGLKRRLYEANLTVVEVRKNQHLYVLDSL